jgi:cellulose synthase/poly-beta-1,6-N-acetylglucosamine synthase-like glycosyltransferase
MIWLVALIVVLFVSWLLQAVLTVGYYIVLKRWRVPLIDSAAAPPAYVILCLRGGDPFLSKCIQGLLSQDYPGYRVRFMVDSSADPSLVAVREAVAQHSFTRYEILTLHNPLPTCSLKCSGLAQAVEDLVGNEELIAAGGFVALLDADTIPHPTWLRELATGLQDANVGAVTGNRWYMPDRPSLGAMTRHIWNAAAIVQMYFYKIAWGGTLAIKLDSIRRADLLRWWTLALCEDTMTQKKLATIGQRLQFIPSLMMVNREDVSLMRLVPWIRRQLLTTRLYHPYWHLVLFHGISSAAQLLWGWGMGLYFLVQGNWSIAAACVATMVVYQLALNALLPWISAPVEAIVAARSEPVDWRKRLTMFTMTWAVLVTQWAYTWALVTCIFTRSAQWRGIEYRVDGPWQIHMLGYQPFQSETPEGNESL